MTALYHILPQDMMMEEGDDNHPQPIQKRVHIPYKGTLIPYKGMNDES